MTTQVFTPSHEMWKHFNQVRDCTDNDNMTPFMQAKAAREWEAWAASKANNPTFAQMAFTAVCHAQEMRRSARSR